MKPAEHGTAKEYRRGCRCEECKLAYAHYQKALRVKNGGSNYPPHAHGTTSEYRRGCRCRDCTDAINTYGKARYARLKAEGRLTKRQEEDYYITLALSKSRGHGKQSLYQQGCRCEVCVTAHRERNKKYAARKWWQA